MIIGLTGGIGSGKSTVSEMLREKGCIIIDADKISRELTAKGSPVLHELAKAFGQDILESDGSLKRKLLGERAFSSDENTLKLNNITAPALKRIAKSRIDMARLLVCNEPCIYDAPLLFEAGHEIFVDEIWVVTCDKEVRIARVMDRDGMTRHQILNVMAKQMPDEERASKADVVIDNSGTLEDLKFKVNELLKKKNLFPEN